MILYNLESSHSLIAFPLRIVPCQHGQSTHLVVGSSLISGPLINAFNPYLVLIAALRYGFSLRPGTTPNLSTWLYVLSHVEPDLFRLLWIVSAGSAYMGKPFKRSNISSNV